mgnify:CR=1 FL=1
MSVGTAMTGNPQPSPDANRDKALRRLRLCGWTGVAGLVAAIYIVVSLLMTGPADIYAAGGVTGWLIVAAVTWLCFAVTRKQHASQPGPLGSLKWLSLTALAFPGIPILFLAPWALAIGVMRLVHHADPVEMVFVTWGAFGIAYFAVLGVILHSVRTLRKTGTSTAA